MTKVVEVTKVGATDAPPSLLCTEVPTNQRAAYSVIVNSIEYLHELIETTMNRSAWRAKVASLT